MNKVYSDTETCRDVYPIVIQPIVIHAEEFDKQTQQDKSGTNKDVQPIIPPNEGNTKID